METVELIAAGYEWICLNCNADNKEVTLPLPEPSRLFGTVTCAVCGMSFEAGNAHHVEE